MCSVRKEADDAYAEFAAAHARLLRKVAALAESEAWHGDGAGDLASWLCARWQINRHTARAFVRDADVVRNRPELDEALSSGSVSIDQFAALRVVSDGEADGAWLEALPFWSLPELEREARRETAKGLERKDGGTYFRMRHTADERFVCGEFQLHPEDGALLMAALDPRIPDGTKLRDYDAAAARALVDLAAGSGGGPATVVLAVDEIGDVAALSSGGYVGADTARRLACDARIQIGERTSRTIPAAVRRAVEARDSGMCVFPGCERRHHLQCHHVITYAQGGPTTVDNLLSVCWTHHTLIHEGKWSLRGSAGPDITWVRPDGTPFEPRMRITEDTS